MLPGYNLTSKRLEPNVLSKNCAAVLNQLDVKAHKEAHGKVASNATHLPAPPTHLLCGVSAVTSSMHRQLELVCAHTQVELKCSHASCRAHELSGIPTGAQVYTPPEAAYHAAYHGAYHGAYASPQGSVQP